MNAKAGEEKLQTTLVGVAEHAMPSSTQPAIYIKFKKGDPASVLNLNLRARVCVRKITDAKTRARVQELRARTSSSTLVVNHVKINFHKS